MTKRVTVLYGGVSGEREVSLVSGAAVAASLRETGHAVRLHDVTDDVPALIAALTPRPDAVFNALHGRYGEDGCVQGLLELLRLPYTHSGVLASAIAMNKPQARRVAQSIGIAVPEGRTIDRAELARGHPLPPPYVLKPVAEGSTIGVHIVTEGTNRPLRPEDWTHGASILAEAFIPGRELTVGVMGDRPLAVTEIRFEATLFDYTAKYTPGHARHVIPAAIPAPVYAEAMRRALDVHRALGCAGISRSDFRYDDRAAGPEGLYFLEINTQPGFTPISLVPEQARHVGVSFGELCAWLVEQARCHA